MASNRAIGLNNAMPWHLSADLKKFKRITMGSAIIMGRKTFESIGRPLPGRDNIIISRNKKYQQDGCQVFQDIDQAIDSCRHLDEIFVIGGASLYKSVLPYADFLYLTEIHEELKGDTFFPEINNALWHELSRETIEDDSSVNFAYSFVKLAKKDPSQEYASEDVGC